MGPGPWGGFTARGGIVLLGLLLIANAVPLDRPPVPTAPKSVAAPTPAPSVDVWDGRLASSFCIPDGIGSCVGVERGDQDDLHLFPGPREIGEARIVLEWTPVAGGPTQLHVLLEAARGNDCGDGCSSLRLRPLRDAQGPSPVQTTWGPGVLEDGEQLAVVVRAPGAAAAGPVYSEARLAQPFHVALTVG